MTVFEEIGIKKQYECESRRDANKKFRYSCYLCCCNGVRIDCNRCAIQNANNEINEIYDEIESNRKRVEIKRVPEETQVHIVVVQNG